MKNRKFLNFILLILLFLIIIILIALSPIFNIKKINIRGNIHYKEKDIISMTDIRINNNWFNSLRGNILLDIFTFRSNAAEKSILNDKSYIKNVQVRYYLNGTVLINILEREPKFYIPYLGTNLIIDKEDYILDSISDIKTLNLPIVKGLELDEYELGKVIRIKDEKHLASLNKIVDLTDIPKDTTKNNIFDLINYIDLSDPLNISFIIDNRLLVRLGAYNEIDRYKINFLKEIFFVRLNKYEKGVLDFTQGDNPIFRPEN